MIIGKRRRAESDPGTSTIEPTLPTPDDISPSKSRVIESSSPKRRRLLRFPLTRNNLESHTQATMPRTPAKKSVEPSIGSTNAELALDHSLKAHDIRRDHQCTLPPDVSDFLEVWYRQIDNSTATPMSKHLASKASEIKMMAEDNGMDWYTVYFGRKPEGQHEGTDTVHKSVKQQWLACCVPVPENPSESQANALKACKPLTTPCPDVAYGYNTETFSEDEQLDIGTLNVKKAIVLTASTKPYFPYFVQEWKSNSKGGTMHDAENQAMRDGAVAVCALHRLFDMLGHTPK